MITLIEYLMKIGKHFPDEDANGFISEEAFQKARLPMVVSCAHCEMTMALCPDLPVEKSSGRVFCDDCGEAYEQE